MGDEVFEHLDRRHPRLSFVGYPRFSANAHNHLVVVHAVHEVAERLREDFGIGVNLVMIPSTSRT